MDVVRTSPNDVDQCPQLEEWLNLNMTIRQLGIPSNAPAHTPISFVVNADFETSKDVYIESGIHVAQLLERYLVICVSLYHRPNSRFPRYSRP